MLNIPSPDARSISESCMTSVAKHVLPKHMLSVKDVLALVVPAPIVSEQLVVWCVCIKVPAL